MITDEDEADDVNLLYEWSFRDVDDEDGVNNGDDDNGGVDEIDDVDRGECNNNDDCDDDIDDFRLGLDNWGVVVPTRFEEPVN